MKIGFIGAGEIGGTLIRQYSTAGHNVKMANSSGVEKLKSLALETGAFAVKLAEVVTDVDVIVVSIPMNAIPTLPKDLFKNIFNLIRMSIIILFIVKLALYAFIMKYNISR